MAVNSAGHSHGTRMAQSDMAPKGGPAARAPSRLGSLRAALARSGTSSVTVIGYLLAFASDSARAFVEISLSASRRYLMCRESSHATYGVKWFGQAWLTSRNTVRLGTCLTTTSR